jgi:hypothetical protein
MARIASYPLRPWHISLRAPGKPKINPQSTLVVVCVIEIFALRPLCFPGFEAQSRMVFNPRI